MLLSYENLARGKWTFHDCFVWRIEWIKFITNPEPRAVSGCEINMDAAQVIDTSESFPWWEPEVNYLDYSAFRLLQDL